MKIERFAGAKVNHPAFAFSPKKVFQIVNANQVLFPISNPVLATMKR